jgi:excisionase family DNA binding protein
MAHATEKKLPPYRSDEAAAVLGTSTKAVIAAVKKGRLAGAQLNRIWLINREQVDRLARGHAS